MQPLGVKLKPQLLADLGLDGGLDCRHHGAGADFDIEQDLRAEPLDDFDDGGKLKPSAPSPETRCKSSGRMPSVTSLPT